VNYLIQKRLQWGVRDTQAAIKSVLDEDPTSYIGGSRETAVPVTPLVQQDLVTLPAEGVFPPTPSSFQHDYFTADSPPELISIIQNDWPYSG
jgi:hypothetical protein